MTNQLARLVLTGEGRSWQDAGFTVSADDTVTIGSTVIEFVGDGECPGIVSAHLVGSAGVVEADGLPLHATETGPAPGVGATTHRNGVTAIDHLVAMTPDLDRTADAMAAAGLDLRRRRDAERDGHEVHQLFYWLGDVILEVVESPQVPAASPAEFWGLALTVDDLDATADVLGPLMGESRDAVQSGRRIASLKRDAGLSVPIAFMTPHSTRR